MNSGFLRSEKGGEDIPAFISFFFNELSEKYGRIINTEEQRGKIGFIQFINPKSVDQIDLLINVYRDFLHRNDIFNLILVKDINEFLNKITTLMIGLNLVAENYEKYKLLSAPECCEPFFIFDKEGKIIYMGNEWIRYEEILKPLLLTLLNRSGTFSLSLFAEEGAFISETPWLSQLEPYINHGNFNYYVFSFHVDICSSCLSGYLIERIRTIKKNYKRIFLPQ